jgi:hypothetical protein
MANRLSMAQINAIVTLHASEHSNREIGRLLWVHRETVGKYLAAQNSQTRPPGQRHRIRDTNPCSTPGNTT